jgi:hypothetical protein
MAAPATPAFLAMKRERSTYSSRVLGRARGLLKLARYFSARSFLERRSLR